MKKRHNTIAVLAALTFSHVQAADITWDIAPGTVGSGDSAITGGAGAWNTTDGNWTVDGGANNIAWDNTLNAADTALFTTGSGTVTLGGAINLGGLTLNSAGYTITAETLNFGAAQGSINTSALGTGSNQTTIASALTGSAGLTINPNGNLSSTGGGSTGRLNITGDNTGLTGGIAITGGLVDFASSSAAGSASTTAGSGNQITLSNGGGLIGPGGRTLGNNIVLSTGGGTFRVFGSQTLTLNGVISGTTGFNKTDNGTLTLTNTASTFQGAVNVQAGTLRLGNMNANSTFAFTGSSLSVASGATLALGSASGGTITVNYTFANLTEPISVNGGTVSFIQTNNTTQNMAGALAISGASTINLTASAFSGHTAALNGAITGSTGSLTFTASGGTGRNFAIGNAAHNYTGNVILGTASASSVFNLNNVLGTADWTINNANWRVNVSNTTHTFKSLNSSVNALITSTGASSKLDIGSGDTDSTYAGRLEGTLAIEKSGDGTLTLSGASTYTGATTVSAGTLLVTGSLGDTAVTVANGATIGGDGIIAGTLDLASGAMFLFDESATLTVDGATVTFGGFSIANLFGLDSSTENGTYTLIDGEAVIDFTNIANVGAENAYDLGGGKSAYFQSGSLQVVVIPEPATALLGGLGFLAMFRRRRG